MDAAFDIRLNYRFRNRFKMNFQRRLIVKGSVITAVIKIDFHRNNYIMPVL